MSERDPVVVLITFPVDNDVEEFAANLVSEGIVACVTILSGVDSIYRWAGQVERTKERQLLVKTTGDRVNHLESRVAELHPYDVPELLVLPVLGGDERYLAWIKGAVNHEGSEV